MKKILNSLIVSGLAALALTSCCCGGGDPCADCYQGPCWKPPVPEERPKGCPRPHFWNRCRSNPSNYEY